MNTNTADTTAGSHGKQRSDNHRQHGRPPQFCNPDPVLFAFPTSCGATFQVTAKTIAHLQCHGDVIALLLEAITSIATQGGSKVEAEVDLGRPIGISSRLASPPILPTDRTLFAYRKGRDFPTRVGEPGAEGEPTSFVTVVAIPQSPGVYRVLTAWVGNKAKREPWDPTIRSQEDFDDCLRFWCANSLCFDETMGKPFESTWKEVIARANGRWRV